MSAEKVRIKEIPEYKKKIVEDLVNKIKSSKTVLLASTKGLPSSQFNQIKKNLRGKADVKLARKTAIVRAIEQTEKGALQNLKAQIGADMVLFFSDLDAFSLSGLLSDNRSPARAKAGDIAPEDINVEAGPTELLPGPAISELGSVGLKVAVEGGKLAIKKGATVAKKGDVIDAKLSSVLGKLGISPMKVGFEPIAAYDAESDKVYVGIKIDKEATLEELRDLVSKALGFAINVSYPAKETIIYMINKAGAEEKALEALVDVEKEEKAEESKEEEKPAEEEKKEEEKAEEKKEEKVEEEEKKEEKPEEKEEEKKEEKEEEKTDEDQKDKEETN